MELAQQVGKAGPVVSGLDDLAAYLATDPECLELGQAACSEHCVELILGDEAVVFLGPSVFRDGDRLQPYLARVRAGRSQLVLVGSEAELAGMPQVRDRGALAVLPLPARRDSVGSLVRTFVDLVAMRQRAADRARWADRYRYELGELISISRAISSERDLGKLLGLILEKSRYVTGADAGSVYVLEGDSVPGPGERGGQQALRFKVTQNDSLAVDFTEFTLPVDARSVVGATVISREIVNIPDLYTLATDNPWGFHHDRSFDDKTGYQTRSMLTVPMINARDEVIGVIQLINKKRDPHAVLRGAADFEREVIPFDKRSEELCQTLAAQAGISLENALLYQEVRQLFDGFVRASVVAIESRDPTTSGHSQRVATLTVGLAEGVDRLDAAPFRDVRFTADQLKQIEYAGLLHDFGKVGVREKVLVKAKKLYESEWETLLGRFDYIRKALEAEHATEKVRALVELGRDEAMTRFGAIDAAFEARLRELDEYLAFVQKANEPTVLPQGGFERIADIARHVYRDARGHERPFLAPAEVQALQIRRGSLTAEERQEIESHVVHTYNFLRLIPWGRSFREIPRIAGTHHEKLDGTGYPHGLRAEAIPLEAQMMTIADIFDALTASDRPYKKAVPVDKALSIIEEEVKMGKCSADLFKVFVEARIYTRVL